MWRNEKCTPNMAGKYQGNIKTQLGVDSRVIPNASARNGVLELRYRLFGSVLGRFQWYIFNTVVTISFP
jgi:hypothetical protein